MKTSASAAEARFGRQIMNMSAPPRTQIVVETIRTAELDSGKDRGKRAGLELRLKISRDQALHCNLPGCFKAESIMWSSRKKILSGLLLLSMIALDRKDDTDRNEMRKMMKRSTESLTDEYMENVGLLKPLSLGLPAFAMAESKTCRMGAETNPARMLAVYSRTSNGLFIASRLPVRPDCAPLSNPRYLLYVPG